MNTNISLGTSIGQREAEASANRWEFDVGSYTVEQVKLYCVQDAEWQRFRLSLKGVSTVGKLAKLRMRRAQFLTEDGTQLEKYRIQIDNYINALKRGGQLDINCNIVR